MWYVFKNVMICIQYKCYKYEFNKNNIMSVDVTTFMFQMHDVHLKHLKNIKEDSKLKFFDMLF